MSSAASGSDQDWGAYPAESSTNNIRYEGLLHYASFTTFELPQGIILSFADKMARLVSFKPHDDDDAFSDAGSDISKEAADVTTALIGTGPELGEPEVRRRFWFSKVEPNAPDSIATQVL